MPRLPATFDDLVVGRSDAWKRQCRYKADGDDSWSNVDLTAATGITVQMIQSDGTVHKTFAALGDDAALFTAESDGNLTFQAAADTFTSADVGSYILRIVVTTAAWAAGKTFPSDQGVRIIA